MRPVVYLSCPMRKGHWTDNVRTASKVAADMIRKGISVVNPMGSWLCDVAEPLECHEWLDNDCGIIEVCHAVYRIPGESEGADLECQHALACSVPVFYDLPSLYEFMDEFKEYE